MKKKIAVFLFDGFSDWEIAYLTPEINKSAQFDLVYFSKNGVVITSMGGLKIRPAALLSELRIEDIDMLVLPGALLGKKEKIKKLKMLRNVYLKPESQLLRFVRQLAFLDS